MGFVSLGYFEYEAHYSPVLISASTQFLKNFLSIPNQSAQPKPKIQEQSISFHVADRASDSSNQIFAGYDSDLSEDEPMIDLVGDDGPITNEDEPLEQLPPKRVHRQLEIPAQVTHNVVCESHKKELKQALDDIEKVV